jgi:hypothetical protein
MSAAAKTELTQRQILIAWWPLAASWLLMGMEMSLVSAAIARLAESKFHLAAFGGIVFPIALLIEAPIIMMLAASTALSVDSDSFRRLRRFTTIAGIGLSLFHALVAFTPLYDILIVGLLDPPAGAIEPGRLGLQLMTLWTWAIADRRFHQGLLIRFDRSGAVGIGTAVRLVVTCSVLLAGILHGGFPGIAVAGCGLVCGVSAEAISARCFARAIVRGPLADAPAAPPLTLPRLLRFYLPLALTPLLNILVQPIGSASIARMPEALDNLATWSPASGLIFMSRSIGIAFNEVVISFADRLGARRALESFALRLAIATSSFLALVALTPLAVLWFRDVSGLTPELLEVARLAVPFGILLPAATVYQSLHTGFLVNAHKTRAVPESVALFLIVTTACLFSFASAGALPGVQATLLSITVGALCQNAWLWRSQRALVAASEEPVGNPSDPQ